MDVENLRPMKKNEAKKVLAGDRFPLLEGSPREIESIFYRGHSELTPGREYEILDIYRQGKNNFYFVIEDNAGFKAHIHRRFFGVKK